MQSEEIDLLFYNAQSVKWYYIFIYENEKGVNAFKLLC